MGLKFAIARHSLQLLIRIHEISVISCKGEII